MPTLLRTVSVLAGLLSVIVAGHLPNTLSADDPAPRTPVAAKPDKAVRLPNHFSRLSLSEKQKTDIYDAVRRYRAEIEPLEARLSELRRDQQTAVENLLTSDQRKQLESIRSTAKDKSAKSKPSKPADK